MQCNFKQQSGILTALVLLMLATRYNHFGTTLSLPDASLAAFLLAGFLLARQTVLAITALIFMLLLAGGIDYYATQIQGISDWCITPAYWFLIPTYATMWFAGRWLGMRQFNNLGSLALFAGTSWLAVTVAFLISNGSFYLFSGMFAEMSFIEYANRIQQYYAPYLSGSLLYLSAAVMLYMLLGNLNKNAISSANK